MNPKLIEAQIEAQALAEAWRASIVEAHAQRLKAKAQSATAQVAEDHAEYLRVQVEQANKNLSDLAEKEEGRRHLSAIGGMRPA